MHLSLYVAIVWQVSRSAPDSTAATVPLQGAFSVPPSLAVCSHKEAVDYLTIYTPTLIHTAIHWTPPNCYKACTRAALFACIASFSNTTSCVQTSQTTNSREYLYTDEGKRNAKTDLYTDEIIEVDGFIHRFLKNKMTKNFDLIGMEGVRECFMRRDELPSERWPPWEGMSSQAKGDGRGFARPVAQAM